MAQRQARQKASGKKRRAAATARVAVSVDASLVARARRVARERGTTLAALVAEGLDKVTGAKAPVLPPGTAEEHAAAPALEQLWGWMAQQQEALAEIRAALGEVAAALPNEPPPARPAVPARIPPL